MILKSLCLSGLMFIAVCSEAQTSASKQKAADKNSSAAQETLQLKQVITSNNKLLRISLETEESGKGKTGMVKVLDVTGNLVAQHDIELIASPSYASVEVSGLTPGSYSVILITDSKVYDSKLDLK